MYRVTIFAWLSDSVVYRSGWTTLDAAQKTADWFRGKINREGLRKYSAVITQKELSHVCLPCLQ